MCLPKSKPIFGIVKAGESGQIVTPKEAGQRFPLKPGGTLLVLGDEEQGIAISRTDVMQAVALKSLNGLGGKSRHAK